MWKGTVTKADLMAIILAGVGVSAGIHFLRASSEAADRAMSEASAGYYEACVSYNQILKQSKFDEKPRDCAAELLK